MTPSERPSGRSSRRPAPGRAQEPQPEFDDIFDLLKHEHAEVRKMFEEIEEAVEDDEPPPPEVVQRLCRSLEAHTFAEEEVFYPALRSVEDTRDATLEALVEHEAVKDLIAEVASGDLRSDEWAASCHVLKEYVTHHVREEEHELFPHAKKVFDRERRQALVVAFLDAKKRAPVVS